MVDHFADIHLCTVCSGSLQVENIVFNAGSELDNKMIKHDSALVYLEAKVIRLCSNHHGTPNNKKTISE